MSNRSALLEAATKCLEERGYARTTARDLVAASGTNLGAIGYHFGSKEGLLNEALAEAIRRWFGEIASVAATAEGDRPEERFKAVADSLYDSFKRNRGTAVALVEAITQAQRSPDVRRELAATYEEVRQAGAAVIEEELAPFVAEGLNARALASLAIAAFEGLLIQWLVDPRRSPSGSEAYEAVLAVIEQATETLAPGGRTPR
jgi:AcrR family transcriptional regulator